MKRTLLFQKLIRPGSTPQFVELALDYGIQQAGQPIPPAVLQLQPNLQTFSIPSYQRGFWILFGKALDHSVRNS